MKKYKIKNEKGFSLAELMVGVGLISILSLILLNTQGFFESRLKHTEQRIEDGINRFRIDAVLFDDLHNSLSSFNKLELPNDKGENFYDLNLSSTKDVSFTLDAESDPFLILAFNMLSPGMRFEVPLESLPSKLTNSRININDNLTHNPDSHRDYNHFSPWTRDGELLLMTSAHIYPDAPKQGVLKPAPYFFVGKIAKSQYLEPIKSWPNKVKFNETKHKNSVQGLITDTPVLKGLTDRFFITPVQLVQYSIQPRGGENLLIRSIGTLRNNGTMDFSRSSVLAERVESVTFKRKISQHVVSFEVVLQR
jgi:prepilin-type N-terminal cleavage/methylation domain-containing protein